MEKLLRYLSPKSVNLEAIPSGGIPLFTTVDACLTLSYAKLTPVQNKLIECYALQHNNIQQLKSAAIFIHSEYVSKKMAELSSDNEIAIYIALVEVCAVTPDYKPSERNRAVIGGISRMQVQRKIGKLVSKFKDFLNEEIEIIEDKIQYQINKNY
ncbi:hypothetical protein [Acinetobacter modestus]|uniref:hypothetical protein n=1 Tax=Acinetobacter modestus TaxID=1776740 RepID=UPI003018B353